MQSMFEYSDTLNFPYEAFLYDAAKSGFPIRAHWHYFMELMYMAEGKALVECGGQSFMLSPGDFMLFHPEVIHAIYAASEALPKYEIIKFDVNRLYTENNYAPKLKTILSEAGKNKNLPVYFSKAELIQYMEDLPVRNIFERCREEIERKDYGYDIILHEQICSLLVAVIRVWRRLGFDTGAVKAEDASADSFHEITAYIDAHVGENLKVEELAARCNMSYSYFARNFKQFYGRSCKEYMELVRVCKAEDLLLFTDSDLNYISQETGFSDSSHLIKTFRKWKGLTPGQYRNKDKKQENSF